MPKQTGTHLGGGIYYEGDATFLPAELGDYRDWLAQYLDQGGDSLRFYDIPFAAVADRMVLAVRDFDMHGEGISDAKGIIVVDGVNHQGPLGCNKLFLPEGGLKVREEERFEAVKVYNDPELLELPGMRKLAKERRATRRES